MQTQFSGGARFKGKCPRCLQLLPGKVARCPNCGQPATTSSRRLRFAIGIVGLLALLFAIAIMYRTVYEEDLENTATSNEEVEKTPEEELFPSVPPESAKKIAPRQEAAAQ